MRKGAAFEAAAQGALVAGERIVSRGICWAAQAPPRRWLLFVMRRQYQIVLTDHRLLVFRRKRKPPTSRDLILAKRYDAFVVEKVTRWRPLMYVRLRAPNGTQLVFNHALAKGIDPNDPREPFEDAEREPVILLEHIARARFEYRALDDRGKLGEWQDDWDLPGRSPLLVRIDIEFERGSRLVWPEFVVPLMIDPGAITTALEPNFFMGTQQ